MLQDYARIMHAPLNIMHGDYAQIMHKRAIDYARVVKDYAEVFAILYEYACVLQASAQIMHKPQNIMHGDYARARP